MTDAKKNYDLFICHASEDKDSIVRELAAALRNLGLAVWYDEFSLQAGDSLSASIDRGLAASRFGLVVLSPAFFEKRWPQRELQGLVAREMAGGAVILPIWHRVSRDDVLSFSPPLADKIALVTANADAVTLALQILQRVRPDLYLRQRREDLEQLAGDSVVAALQDEIDDARHELEHTRDALSEFQCPTCGARLLHAMPVEFEYGDYRVETFECGRSTEDGHETRPCPGSPDYPCADDYALSTTKQPNGDFMCVALPKTPRAHRVSVYPGFGTTQSEAESQVRRRLPQPRTLRKPRTP